MNQDCLKTTISRRVRLAKKLHAAALSRCQPGISVNPFATIRRFFSNLLTQRRLSRRLASQLIDTQLEALEERSKHVAYVERMAAVVLGFRNRLRTATEQRDQARKDLAELERELADVRKDLKKAEHTIEVANETNGQLHAVIQRDRARINAEKARHNRRQADNETGPVNREET